MIEELRIKDFAIIENLIVPLKRGFNVITGETGAGKSIIVDALSILLKEKVTASDFVKYGKKEAVIEAVLADIDSECEDDILIIKRVLNTQGKSRAFINESAYTAQGFTNIVSKYINIHGQHEHTYLLRKENHIIFLDLIAGLNNEVKEYNNLYDEAQKLREDIEKSRYEFSLNKERRELYEFQLNEIKSAKLDIDEERELIEKRQILRNALRLRDLAESSFMILYDDKNSVYSNLSKILSQLDELSKYDSAAQEIKGLLENSYTYIEESIYLLRKLKEKYEPDPILLEKVEERLSLIGKLKSKYGNTIEEILNYAIKIEEMLNSVYDYEEELIEKEKKLKELDERLNFSAEILSSKRKESAKNIEEKIIEELKFLGFSNSQFEIRIKEIGINNLGKDDVEFFFSANPGEPPRPLNKVASGGELSRLMLALKCVELKMHKGKLSSMTLVFDEIDAGIGGKVAENVGLRLKELAKVHQVLCVTHLPQIAALGENHIKVNKILSENQTYVEVIPLTGQQRKEEIARMLSGKVTESSLMHAEELLK